MKTKGKKGLTAGIALLCAFLIWTALVMFVDVAPAEETGTNIGLSALNVWFHGLTGVNMGLCKITDWGRLGIVPLIVVACFGVFGVIQLIKRKSVKKVDADILLLGAYYAVILLAFLFFEAVTVNYRPILINGELEGSYPSTTTLLVLSIMPTLLFQVKRRAKSRALITVTAVFVILFSAFMVVCRTLSGVHWLSDIIGAVLLSAGLYLVYRSAVMLTDGKKDK
ncbi:MAG: phosphatase PAP2 family protein [Clostridia bacterium]|nr:phosphatase PAP2 family protein [Clostridia bacterium]